MHATIQYRFLNGMAEKDGHLCRDVNALLHHLVAGLKERGKLGKIPQSLGIDT